MNQNTFSVELDKYQQETVRRAYSWFIGDLAVRGGGDNATDALCPDFALLTIVDPKDVESEYVSSVSADELDELVIILDGYQSHVTKTEKPTINGNRGDHNSEWPYIAAGLLSQSVRFARSYKERTVESTILDIALSNREAASV